MPRFYFDLVSLSGKVAEPDAEGGEFTDAASAIKDAETGYADLLAEAILEGRALDFSAIDVRDASRKLIETLRFDETGKRIVS